METRVNIHRWEEYTLRVESVDLDATHWMLLEVKSEGATSGLIVFRNNSQEVGKTLERFRDAFNEALRERRRAPCTKKETLSQSTGEGKQSC